MSLLRRTYGSFRSQVLDQVLQIQNTNWESYAVDFTHIGTLFVLDRRKNGKFFLEVPFTPPPTLAALVQYCAEFLPTQRAHVFACTQDFMEFASLCKMVDDLYRKSDFGSNFKAYCTLVLWTNVAKDVGVQKFVRWCVPFLLIL